MGVTAARRASVGLILALFGLMACMLFAPASKAVADEGLRCDVQLQPMATVSTQAIKDSGWKAAKQIKLGATVSGRPVANRDFSWTDCWYKFTTDSDTNAEYTITLNAKSAQAYTYATLIDSALNVKGTTYKKGAVGTIKKKLNAKSTYYVVVSGKRVTDSSTANARKAYKVGYALNFDLTVNKAPKEDNTITASGKTITVKAKQIEKKAKSYSRSWAFSVSKAKGTVTYKKVSGNSKIKVSNNGSVTLQKGLKKGKYTVPVNVTAAGTSKYKAKTVPVKLTVRVEK